MFRYQFIRDYTLKTLRLKLEKWNKLWIIDEQRSLITKFVETGGLGFIVLIEFQKIKCVLLDFMQELVITQTIGGVIHIHLDWPSYLKSKGVYFVKKDNSKIPEAECGKLLDYVTCGDVHSNILGKKIKSS